MITLTISRQYAEALRDYFFPEINLYKQTWLNNVRHLSFVSDEYISACVINCVLSEIEHGVLKKLINTSGPKVKLPLTDAQAIVLYKTLLRLPMNPGNVYLDLMRNGIIKILDTLLAGMQLYQTAKDRHSTA